MKNISHFLGKVFVPVVALTLVFAACDSSNGFQDSEFTSEDLELDVAYIAQDLGLTVAGTEALNGAFASHEGQLNEPGFLWRVAADLQQTLTAEEKQAYFDRYDARGAMGAGFGQGGQGMFGQAGQGPGGFGQRPGGQGMRHFGQRPGGFGQAGQGMGHFGQGGGAQGQGLFGGVIDLTDDQKAQIEAIHDAHADEVQALMDARRDGSISVEDFRTQMDELHATIRAEVDAVLTDEQKQQLEDHRAEREANRADREARREANREEAKAVMIEVLGLNDGQVADLDALHADREAFHESIRGLITNGSTREEIMEQLEAARADFEATIALILDDTQFEIFRIHAVIAQRMGQRKGQGGGNGPGMGGQRQGGQMGPGVGQHHGGQNGGQRGRRNG